ncbi:MAG: tetratricopeptide repeat protein, partial [Thermoanaerobaculia bacterium]|nr:tetratricopeptide repeat protein [Thermoanaerobaculia bacterium]
DSAVAPTFPSEEAKRARATALFEGVVQEHEGSPAGEVAKVYLARLFFEEGRTEEARELWQQFLDENPDHMLAAAVKLNLLDLERAAGNTEAVVEDLRASLEAEDSPVPTDALLFELAESLEELGRSEEARTMYQRLADEYPDSAYAGTAQQKLRDLEPAAA